MIEAVLFDLDDTLLGNDMEKFLPHYFSLLGRHAERFLDKERFLKELMAGTQAMIANTDTAVSNRDIFWRTFQARTGLNPDELEPFFDQFYRQSFPQLAATTTKRPSAEPVVRYCFDQGYKVVIATNPLFPLVAVEERLEWAGLPVTQYGYDLVTAYENMHATKPSPAYYREILTNIDCQPEAAIMIGDDWKNDIIPAAALGIHAYWIVQDGSEPPDGGHLNGHGSLAEFWESVSTGWLGDLT